MRVVAGVSSSSGPTISTTCAICSGSCGSCAGSVVKRMWRRTYSDGRSLTHGTSRHTPFQSLSNRQSCGGSQVKPHSRKAIFSSGSSEKTPSATKLIICVCAMWALLA